MFTDLKLEPSYDSTKCNIPMCFYNPVLMNAVDFDRVSAYFSAKALSNYATGLEYFGNHGHRYRLIVSKELSEEDFLQIKAGYDLREALLNQMIESLDEPLSLREEKNISNLAYLISRNVVDVKIAFKPIGKFHVKYGLATDSEGNKIYFSGSNNESDAAVSINYESFNVIYSWRDTPDHFYGQTIIEKTEDFKRLWANLDPDVVVMPAQKVLLKKIQQYNKGELIVDEVLLTPESAILDLIEETEQLRLQVNSDVFNRFINSTFYKRKLRSKVSSIKGNSLFFKTGRGYTDYIKIDHELHSYLQSEFGLHYYETQRFLNYIKRKNLYIQERAKLGIELKVDSTQLDERYLKFAEVVTAHMTRTLREQQMHDAFFMYAMVKSGNFSVPGSGKTTSALAVYAFLKANDLVDRVVMIGPKNSFDSWVTEFKKCFSGKEELCLFSSQDSSKTKSQKQVFLQYDNANTNLYLFNYECLGSYLNQINKIVSNRTLLVFDEVHKVKSIESVRAADALDIAKHANFLIAMTGTPIPNSYLDLYNLLHIMYNSEYDDYFAFPTYMLAHPSEDDLKTINEKIQPFFCRTTKDQLCVPPAEPDKIISVDSTLDEQALFDILIKKYAKNKFALIIRLLQLESNPSMLLQTLDLSEFAHVLDIDFDTEEVDIVDYSDAVRKLINSIGLTSKKQKCINLVKKLVSENKKVIVWCIFKDSILSLTKSLSSIGISAKYIMGSTDTDDRQTILDDFRSEKFDVLITNPHTLAESISLHTVCHDAVYFEYSYNLVHLLQSKDRIHRLGLDAGQYTQYYYLQQHFAQDSEDYSLDEKIYSRLNLKEQTMLDAIDNQTLEPVYTTEEDLEKIFSFMN